MSTFKKINTEQTRFTYKPLNRECYNVLRCLFFFIPIPKQIHIALRDRRNAKWLI